MAKQVIQVNAPNGAYPVLIGQGILAALPSLLQSEGITGRAVVVSNDTVGPLYGEGLAAALGAPLITVPDGEQYKTLDTVRTLYGEFLRAGLDRSGFVLAVGGGVVGDMAGFAAATYMRGVRLVQVPTSLLAMVDASIGGKVGVDLPEGKNLAGVFKQPEMVLSDLAVLDTLPREEFSGGMAEAIKSGLIGDGKLLEMAQDGDGNEAKVPEIVARAVRVKVSLVEADPYEQGRRAVLNLGHTFAHAIETLSGYTWGHGRAVAVGLVAAARLSAALGLCDGGLPREIAHLLHQWALPVRAPGFEAEALYEAMAHDKKRENGRLRFVLLRGVGQPELVDDVPQEALMEALMELSRDG